MIPDRQESTEDLERGLLMGLPMGGLLSELLASEGVDPANLADVPTENEAGEAPMAVAPEAGPEQVCQTSPVHEAGEDGGAWLGGGIAMPGLLADLIHLEQATGGQGSDEVPEAPDSGGPPIDVPPLQMPELPVRPDVLAETKGSGDEPAGGDSPTPLSAACDAAESVPVGAVQAEALAMPGLFRLLSAEASEGPDDAIRSRELAGRDAAPAVSRSAGETPAAGYSPAETREEGVMLAPGEAGEPAEVKDSPAAGLRESDSVSSDELDMLDLEDAGPVADPASALQAAEDEDPGYEPGGVAEPVRRGYEPEEEKPLEQVRPAESPVAPRDARAEAAEQDALANLIGQIDSEISASPTAGAEVGQTDDKDAERFVVFRLGGNSYGLHMKLVREVEKAGRVTEVPSAPPLLRGLINLRGEILPLIDPRPLLGLHPAAQSAGGYLVVVQARGDEMPVALLVDELGGVAPVDPASVAPVYGGDDTKAGLAGHVLGQAEHRGRSVLLLDHRRLVTDDALLEAFEGGGRELEETGR